MPKAKSKRDAFVALGDRLPPAERMFEKFRKVFNECAAFYGFEKIGTSVLDDPRPYLPLVKSGLFAERTPLWCRTKDNVEVFVRPAGVFSVLRAYLFHKMEALAHPLKFVFAGESFFLSEGGESRVVKRDEAGFVVIGEEGPIAEAEILQAIWKALEELKIGNLELRVNAPGCATCRTSYRQSLSAYFRNRVTRLCKRCKRHLKHRPTRLLACEEEKCRLASSHAPHVLDFLCETCKKHLRGFLEFLDEVHIPYFLDPAFFRDELWFQTILFECAWSRRESPPLNNSARAESSEAPNPEGEHPKARLTLAEGGRMSSAASLMAGRPLEVASGVLFFDALARATAGREHRRESRKPKVFLAQLGELGRRKSLALLETLRRGGIEVRESLGRDSIKSQLKLAERLAVDYALILGQKEALDNTIIVREIRSGIQETIPQERIVEFLKKKLKK